MHKSVDVALLQEKLAGPVVFAARRCLRLRSLRAAELKTYMSNQVRNPAKINRLARLPLLGARAICCVDDRDNVDELSKAAVKHGTTIECLIEIDCGAGRCGVTTTPDVVEIAKAIDASDGLKFSG